MIIIIINLGCQVLWSLMLIIQFLSVLCRKQWQITFR